MHLCFIARANLIALPHRPGLTRAVDGALAVLVMAAAAVSLGPTSAHAQSSPPAASPTSPPNSKAVIASKPLWSDLNSEQQAALQPLAPHWAGLTEAHKRKWIALSRNYATLSPEGRTTLHSRMSDWAGLSFQQRAQARLNFAEIQRLAADERKAKWEAYQALSEDERATLARRAPPRSPGAALPLQPVPLTKLAPTPAVAPGHSPRIQLAPPAAPTARKQTPAASAPAPATLPPEASPAAQ